MRYAPDGSPDSAFGIDGKVITAFDSGGAEAKAAVIQPDGKIVVVGTNGENEIALARYQPSGALDPTFGMNGRG